MTDFGKGVQPREDWQIAQDEKWADYRRQSRARKVKALLIGFGSVSGGVALVVGTALVLGSEGIMLLVMLIAFVGMALFATLVAYDELERRA